MQYECSKHRACVLARLSSRCSQRNPVACVVYAAEKYRQPVSVAECVARSESTFNPYASNGSHFGLYQFDQGTWDATPYARAGHSYWSARWNALGAMWYWGGKCGIYCGTRTGRWTTYGGCV